MSLLFLFGAKLGSNNKSHFLQMLMGGGGSFSAGGPGKGMYSRLCKFLRYTRVHSEF